MKNNLKKLIQMLPEDRIHLRFPNIPGYNSPEDVKKSLEEFDDINCVKEVFDYVYVHTQYNKKH